MKPSNLIPLVLSLASSIYALQILPTTPASNFPECGINCAGFTQAQETCGSQQPNLAAENCFCQFSAVQPFYASPDNVCAQECSSGQDRAALKTWFTGFCATVGSGTDPLAATTTQNTASPTGTAVFQPGPPTKQNETGSAWFKDHWQWILMLVILIIGLTGFGFLVRWLRNRHERKLAEMSNQKSKRSTHRLSELIMSPAEKPKNRPASDASDLWGPHQHMAASQGYQHDMEHGYYPQGGARADPWRMDSNDPSKFNAAGNVQVEEIQEVRPHSNQRNIERDRSRTQEAFGQAR